MISPIIDEQTINRLRSLINGVQRIVITCHKSPDGDALGSTLALCHVLRRLGKDAVVVTPDMAPRSLEFVPGVRDIVVFTKHELRARHVLKEAQLVFCLDFNAASTGWENSSSPSLRDVCSSTIIWTQRTSLT